MVPYRRSQSRLLKTSGSRSGVRLSDVWSTIRYITLCIGQSLLNLWDLNPVFLVVRRWRQLHHLNTLMALSIRPRVIDLATDFLLSDERRKRKLLSWVKSILPMIGEEVLDFTISWQDGIVLCALMEAINPGACPRFNQLKPHHRVNNCRLGLQLAMQYLQVTQLPLSPEEMAIADDGTEVKICHLVQLLKWKYQKHGCVPTVVPAVSLDEQQPCKCHARGTGIRAGIVGRRAKFNILTENSPRFDLEIEIRGPKNEYNREKIVSVNAVTPSRFGRNDKTTSALEDDSKVKVIAYGEGQSFLRQKSMDEDLSHLTIPFDCQWVGEGRFLVTYIPRNAGLHYITVLSRDVHINGSPFEVKVSDWVSSWNLVSQPPLVPFDVLQRPEEKQNTLTLASSTDGVKRTLGHVAQVSQHVTKTKRRILRKVITPNGEEIICDVTSTLLRQKSDDSEISVDEIRDTEGTDRANKGIQLTRFTHCQKKSDVSAADNSKDPGTNVQPRVKHWRNGLQINQDDQDTPEIIVTHDDDGTPDVCLGDNIMLSDPDVAVTDNEPVRKLYKHTNCLTDHKNGNVSLPSAPGIQKTSRVSSPNISSSFTSIKEDDLENRDGIRENTSVLSPQEERAPSDRGSPYSRSSSPFPRVNDVVDLILDKRGCAAHKAGTGKNRKTFSLDGFHRQYPSPFSQKYMTAELSLSPHVLSSSLSVNEDSIRDRQMDNTSHISSFLPGFSSSNTEELPVDTSLRHISPTEEESVESWEREKSGDSQISTSEILKSIRSSHSQCEDMPESNHVSTYSHRCFESFNYPASIGCEQKLATSEPDLHHQVINVVAATADPDAGSLQEVRRTAETSHNNECSECKDITKRMDNSNTFTCSTDIYSGIKLGRIHTQQASSSVDLSDLESKNKISWSLQTNLSDERKLRKSLSDPFVAQNIARKGRAEILQTSFTSASSARFLKDGKQELTSPCSEEDSSVETNEEKMDNNVYKIDILNGRYMNSPYYSFINDTSCLNSMRKNNWSDSKSVTLPVLTDQRDEPSWDHGQNCFNRATLEDKVSTANHETAEPPRGVVEFGHTQNEIDREEFPLEDDEILQVVIEPKTTKPHVTLPLTVQTTDHLSPLHDNQRCKPEFEVTSLSFGQESMLKITSKERDNVNETSPISEMFNKSESSDWSDNDDWPEFSTNQRSAKTTSNYLLKGDWSPQFVELNYNSGIKSRRGSTTKNSSDTTNTALSLLANNKGKIKKTTVLDGELRNSDYDILNTDNVDSCEIFSDRDNLRDKPVEVDTEHHKIDHQNILSNQLYRRSLNTCNHGHFKYVQNKVENAVLDDSRCFLKRRRKPVYTHESLSERHFGQNYSTNIVSHENTGRNSRHVGKNKSYFSHGIENQEHCSKSVCDRSNVCSTCSKFEPVSPASSYNLYIDNWLSTGSSNVNDMDNDADLWPSDTSTSLRYGDSPNINVPNRIEYFNERTLTPTKYRKQGHLPGRLPNSQSPQTKHPPYQVASQTLTSASNHKQSSGLVRNVEDVIKRNILPLSSSKGMSLSPGTRVLTPTKYKRRGCQLEDSRNITSAGHSSQYDTDILTFHEGGDICKHVREFDEKDLKTTPQDEILMESDYYAQNCHSRRGNCDFIPAKRTTSNEVCPNFDSHKQTKSMHSSDNHQYCHSHIRSNVPHGINGNGFELLEDDFTCQFCSCDSCISKSQDLSGDTQSFFTKNQELAIVEATLATASSYTSDSNRAIYSHNDNDQSNCQFCYTESMNNVNMGQGSRPGSQVGLQSQEHRPSQRKQKCNIVNSDHRYQRKLEPNDCIPHYTHQQKLHHQHRSKNLRHQCSQQQQHQKEFLKVQQQQCMPNNNQNVIQKQESPSGLHDLQHEKHYDNFQHQCNQNSNMERPFGLYNIQHKQHHSQQHKRSRLQDENSLHQDQLTKPLQHIENTGNKIRTKHKLGMSQQSTVETMDSGITEDSSRFSTQSSYNDTADTELTRLDDNFNFHLFSAVS